MDAELLIKTKSLLIKHEGFRQYPYVDTVGKITIGVGYNLSDRGAPQVSLHEWCDSDIKHHYEELEVNDWFNELNDDRKIAIVDMRYNLGAKKFDSFKKMISAFKKKDYNAAGKEMIESDWAKQVGNRAIELASIIMLGKLT